MIDLNNSDVVVHSVAIGTGGTGDGTLRGYTNDDQPNTVTRIIGPIRAIAIRFGRMWLTVFLSFSGVGGFSELLPAGSADSVLKAMQALDVRTAAGLALLAALGNFGKDLLFIFTGLEEKYPLSKV